MTTIDFSSFRNALPYIKLFRGKIFIIKAGGEVCEDKTALRCWLEQAAILSSLGLKVVIIHGGGKHSTKISEKLGVTSEFIAGRRVTNSEMLEVAKMSYAGILNTDIVAMLSSLGAQSVGLTGIDAGVNAEKRPLKIIDGKEVDYGFVGDIKSVNTTLINILLNNNTIPVIASLVADSSGQVLNINADDMAANIAGALGVETLLMLGTIDGVLRNIQDPSSILSELSVTEAKDMITSGQAKDGMVPKLEAAIQALTLGVKSVRIVSGTKQDHLLREIFTNEGCGTLIR